METRRGNQGRELLEQFTIAHGHVRRAVAPGCFHPIREVAGRQTLQSLDSQRRSQHVAAQIFQFCSLMGRQAHIRMNADECKVKDPNSPYPDFGPGQGMDGSSIEDWNQQYSDVSGWLPQ